MSATKSQRIMSLVLAIGFFVSTIGIVAYYVLVDQEQASQQQTQADIQEQIKKQIEEQNNQQAGNQGENKLQGTKLQNFQPVQSIASLQYSDTKEGSGAVVKDGDTVTVHYTGALAKDGIIFQSSLDTGETVAFPLDEVIKGWTQGIPGMKVGGIRRLFIPASLAYGATPPQGSGIPANSDLVFDVQLIKIGQ